MSRLASQWNGCGSTKLGEWVTVWIWAIHWLDPFISCLHFFFSKTNWSTAHDKDPHINISKYLWARFPQVVLEPVVMVCWNSSPGQDAREPNSWRTLAMTHHHWEHSTPARRLCSRRRRRTPGTTRTRGRAARPRTAARWSCSWRCSPGRGGLLGREKQPGGQAEVAVPSYKNNSLFSLTLAGANDLQRRPRLWSFRAGKLATVLF